MTEGILEIHWMNQDEELSPRKFGLRFDPYVERKDGGLKESELWGDDALREYLTSIGIGNAELLVGRIEKGHQNLILEYVGLDNRQLERYLVSPEHSMHG